MLYINQEYWLYQEKSLFNMYLLRVKKQFSLYLEMQNKTSKNSMVFYFPGQAFSMPNRAKPMIS